MIHVIERYDTEKDLVKSLEKFIKQVGYSEMFSNFDGIRISTVHPFALFLLADVLGQDFPTNVFPSITVADSSDVEEVLIIGREHEEYVLSEEDVANLEKWSKAGVLFISDSALRILKKEIKKRKIMAEKVTIRERHTFDFNIWTENREVTGFIYDLIKHWIAVERVALHESGYDFATSVTGTRSGNINVEFGKILYGANARATADMSMGSMRIHLDIGEIKNVVINANY